MWNPLQQRLQWAKRNEFLRQSGEYHSVVCVACRDYCCLSCVVSRLFMWNSGYKNIIDCYHTRQQSVIRRRKNSCAKYNKISINGQLRQKKSWVKEKVNFNCHVVRPSIGDVFPASETFAVEMKQYLKKEPFHYIITFPGVTPRKIGCGCAVASKNRYPNYDQNLRFSLPYLWPN